MNTLMRTPTLAPAALAWALIGALAVSTSAADRHVPGDYSTIQAAVDAASAGDTIHIAPGVYEEQVRIISKNLTLIGQPGTILRAFPSMGPAITNVITWRCVLFVHLTPNVVLRDLTFEGDQLGDEQEDGMIGVYYLDSGGAVENCRLTSFREKTPSTNAVMALVFFNDLPGAPLYDVRVAGNTIVDSYKGINLRGAPDKLSLSFVIEDNMVRGVGPTPTENALSGIRLAEGIAGTVKGNTISDFSYNGAGRPFPFGFGINSAGNGNPPNLPSLEPIRIENNDLRDNDVHISMLNADDSEILNNACTGSGPGLRTAGLAISGANVLGQGNQFDDMPVGILAFGNDPAFGTALGIATNAMLIDNRFCNVASNITVQPLATASVTGTLECPYREPELNIAQAARLSWPSYNGDYVLECATDANGPWSLVDTTLIEEEGSLVATVPAEGSQKYFRLHKP